MRLVELTCVGFRGLEDICFQPAPGINVIRGDNAQGKTSLLEAILFLVTSKSHRTNLETDLVKHGALGFRLTAKVRRRDRDVALESNWRHGVKRFKVNGVLQARISDILGKVHVVLFSSEDVALVKGSAAQRRKFMDMELSQLHPRYLNALQQYRLVLRQRNALLRTGKPDHALLDAWDEQLARHGDVLIRERHTFVTELGNLAAIMHQRIAPHEKITVEYEADVQPDEALQTVFLKTRDTDLRRGMTTRGPHRDDLALLVADRPARSFASQGQQKTIALSLRLATLELVKDAVGEYPVLMLDEVLSELDNLRSSQLFDAIDGSVQCLLTTIDRVDAVAPAGLDYAPYVIERGRLEKQ